MFTDQNESIKGEGPEGGVLVLGDKPTKEDLKAGRAFGSKSGSFYRRWAAEVGHTKVRFDYVCNSPAYADYTLIIACGDKALHAVTDNYSTVEDVHSYVLDSIITNAKVVPTFHYNDLFRKTTNAYWAKWAFQKSVEVLGGKKDKPYNLITNNNYAQADAYLNTCMQAESVSVDIETLKFNPILTAISIGHSPDHALSISPEGLSDVEWTNLIHKLFRIIENPRITKIGQNIMFDFLMLWKIYGVFPAGPIWDTMHAANVINCNIEKSLKALARINLYTSPWKGGWNTTDEKLRIYNAQDVVFTYRIQQRQQHDLERFGLVSYFEGIRKMFIPSFKLASRGIKIDVDGREAITVEALNILKPLDAEVKAWAKVYVPPAQKKRKKRTPSADIRVSENTNPEELPKATQKQIYVAKKKDVKFGLEVGVRYLKAYETIVDLSAQGFNPKSSKQVLGVLTNAGVSIPKVKKLAGDWGESTNDKALAQIIERNKDSAEVLSFVTNMRIIRQGNKLLSSYCQAVIDPDGRWRCSYNVEGTETGRSSTKKTPWSTGGNNQNIPRDDFRGIKFKKLFIADDDKILFQSDQEQAEARVVAYLARCPKLIELFETNQDIHVFAISSILGEDIAHYKQSDPTKFKKYRQYGKIVNHGGNYDMGPATLSENAIKQGIVLSVQDAAMFLAKRREVFPEVYEIFHREIQEQLKKTRRLETPFGRKRVFMGLVDNAMFREGYAFIPQSTIPHITNLMWSWVGEACPEAEVLQMGHDALLIQTDKKDVVGFGEKFLAQTKEIKFNLNGYSVNIPWDKSFGVNWAEMKKEYNGN